MIPFFRKLRKKFADNNQFVKYSRYAVGEIFLVVIGILIALQINNWNENRLKKSTVKTYLSNLIQDLKVDQDLLNVMIERHNFKFYSMQYLLNMEGSNTYDPIADRKKNIPAFLKPNFWDAEIPKIYDKEFIQIAYGDTHRDYILKPSELTFNELKNTGMFSNINTELKNDINLYYPICLLKNNPKRIGLMKRMIRESGWTILSAIRLIKRNEELISKLEEEIESI